MPIYSWTSPWGDSSLGGKAVPGGGRGVEGLGCEPDNTPSLLRDQWVALEGGSLQCGSAAMYLQFSYFSVRAYDLIILYLTFEEINKINIILRLFRKEALMTIMKSNSKTLLNSLPHCLCACRGLSFSLTTIFTSLLLSVFTLWNITLGLGVVEMNVFSAGLLVLLFFLHIYFFEFLLIILSMA